MLSARDLVTGLAMPVVAVVTMADMNGAMDRKASMARGLVAQATDARAARAGLGDGARDKDRNKDRSTDVRDTGAEGRM